MPLSVDNALFLQTFFGANLKGEHAMTLAFLAEAPDETLRLDLGDGLPTVATELYHAFNLGPWFLSVIRRGHGDWSEAAVEPYEGGKQQLIRACRERAEETERLLADCSPTELVAEVHFNDERFPAVYMADWHIVHLVHHRALAFGALLKHGLRPRPFYGTKSA